MEGNIFHSLYPVIINRAWRFTSLDAVYKNSSLDVPSSQPNQSMKFQEIMTFSNFGFRKFLCIRRK